MHIINALFCSRSELFRAQRHLAGRSCLEAFMRPKGDLTAVTIDAAIPEGLTFDDVLLVPGKSSVLPTEPTRKPT